MKKDKIYDSIDGIKVSERDKERFYNNIMEKEKETKTNGFGFRKFAKGMLIAVLIFTLTAGTVYAAAKIFNWDKELLDFFGISEKDVEDAGIEPTELTKTVKRDGMTIAINQLLSIDKTWYTMLEITYDKPNAALDKKDDNTLFCHALLETEQAKKLEDMAWGYVEILSINEDKTKVKAVVYYLDDEVMPLIKDGDTVKFRYSIGETIWTTEEDGSGVGVCPDNYMDIEWEVENLVDNNSKYEHKFENIIVKKEGTLEIKPKSIKVTPVDIKLDLRIYGYNSDEFGDEQLTFDNTIDLVFKDGTVIKLNGFYGDESRLVHGSNFVGKENESDDFHVMTLSYDNMATNNPYSEVDFKLIDVDSLEKLVIGDKTIEVK